MSGATFESRQEALAELGRITADPAFDRWDDAVMLVDLSEGTPVLLVRPAAATMEPTEPCAESLSLPEAATFAAMADEQPMVVDLESVVVPEREQLLEPVEVTAPEMPEDLDIATVVESLETEAPEVLVAVEEPAPVEDMPDAGEMGALRAAIERTTTQMEAAGIVAPESIGPAPAAEDEMAVVAEPIGVAEPEAIGEPAAESTVSVTDDAIAELFVGIQVPEPEASAEAEVVGAPAVEMEPSVGWSPQSRWSPRSRPRQSRRKRSRSRSHPCPSRKCSLRLRRSPRLPSEPRPKSSPLPGSPPKRKRALARWLWSLGLR